MDDNGTSPRNSTDPSSVNGHVIDVPAFRAGPTESVSVDTGEAMALECRTVEIDIPSKVELVAVVRMIVAAATNAVGALQGDRLDDLRWVTSEATTNAIEANLSTGEEGRVRVTCVVEQGQVHLVVRDQGPGMPEHYEVPDITHPDRLQIEGAFGVPLMERLSSAVRFESAATGTTVRMDLLQ
jgi:stage II sporulation protein AB (anti-sigma F factor)